VTEADVAATTFPTVARPGRRCILLASQDVVLRIEALTLHPRDRTCPFFALAHQVERTGVEV